MLNSCDAYSDLWENFFSQLKLNFPVVKEMNVYINSESIDFFDNDMKVINVHPSQKHPWSDRLRYCVSKITEEFVISIPEECIIESVVALDQFNQALEILNNDLNTAVVQLVKIPGKKTKNKIGPFIQREYDFRNLISQQASIWRTSKYYEYIKLNETPWEYEVLSSARGPIGNDTFYCIDDNEKEVFDYNYGVLVTRGYWAKEELERIEEKLSISFNRNARPVLTLDEINQKINKYSMFYWKLRYKKYKILLHKMIKSR
jgi:hypothetical protein